MLKIQEILHERVAVAAYVEARQVVSNLKFCTLIRRKQISLNTSSERRLQQLDCYRPRSHPDAPAEINSINFIRKHVQQLSILSSDQNLIFSHLWHVAD